MLRYLFTAQFNDGTMLEQTQDDVSKTNPKKSAFFDVLNDTRKLERFWLLEIYKNVDLDRITPSKYLVDLTDGHFEINGNSFFLHEQTIDESKKLSDFRLIYFRRVQQSMNLTSGEASTKTMFMIGWQANYADGKNEKRILFIK